MLPDQTVPPQVALAVEGSCPLTYEVAPTFLAVPVLLTRHDLSRHDLSGRSTRSTNFCTP
jgi:hypothetical protein